MSNEDTAAADLLAIGARRLLGRSTDYDLRFYRIGGAVVSFRDGSTHAYVVSAPGARAFVSFSCPLADVGGVVGLVEKRV